MPSISALFSRSQKHLGYLIGHPGPVISVAFSPKGHFLASGGVDGVKIWNVKTKEEINIPQQPYTERGQVSAVCWVTRHNETFDTLCYGNALGFLVFLQHRPTENRFESVYSTRIARGGEIICITADGTDNEVVRVATCTRDKCVQVWHFESRTSRLLPISSKFYRDDKEVVPKTLAFDENEDRDLFVFGLYDGGLYKYSGKDAKSISKHQLRSQIGNAAIDLERRICAVDNVGKGFDIYKIDSGNFVKSLTTRDPVKTYPKGVAFVDEGRAIVGGSDHGLVYIFDSKTGQVITTLKHGREGGVENIAAFDEDDGTVLLATTSATAYGPQSIQLWRWTPAQQPGGKQKNESVSLVGIVGLFGKIVIVIAALAYFVQVFDGQYDKVKNMVMNAIAGRIAASAA